MSKQTVTWLTIVMLTAAAGIGLALWQRNNYAGERANLLAQISNLKQKLSNSMEPEVITTENEAKAGNTVIPVVVFNPRGLFDEDTIDTFRDKIINPMTLYARDKGNQINSFFIETSQVSGEYVVNVIYVDGSYESFLTGGSQGIRWMPECEDGCNFSEAFRQKYPDIANQAGGI